MTSSNGNVSRVTGRLPFSEGNSPITGELPSQRPVTRSFGIFLDLKRLSKPSRRRWFETLSHSLWRNCNDENQTFNLVTTRRYLNTSGAPFTNMANLNPGMDKLSQAQLSGWLNYLSILVAPFTCGNRTVISSQALLWMQLLLHALD